jgi:cell division protein FtsB
VRGVASSEPKPSSKPSRRRKQVATAQPGANRKVVRWLLIFAASLIIVDGLFGERGLLAMMRARREYQELSAAIARQRADNARSREEARRLKDDPTAIEEIARRELGLIKPGEKLFIVKDVPPAKP